MRRTEEVALTENKVRDAIRGGMDPVDAYLSMASSDPRLILLSPGTTAWRSRHRSPAAPNFPSRARSSGWPARSASATSSRGVPSRAAEGALYGAIIGSATGTHRARRAHPPAQWR